MKMIDANALILHLNDWALSEAPDETIDNEVMRYTEHNMRRIVWETIQGAIQAVEESISKTEVERKTEKKKLDETYKFGYEHGFQHGYEQGILWMSDPTKKGEGK